MTGNPPNSIPPLININCAAGTMLISASPAGMPPALDTFSASPPPAVVLAPPTISNKIFGGVKIKIFRDGELLGEADSLGRHAFEAMSGVTIETVLDSNGVLCVGGKHRGAFCDHPFARVHVDVINGFITEARIFSGKDITRREYTLAFRDGKLIGSAHYFVTSFLRSGTVVIRKRLGRNGVAIVEGRQFMLEKYPDHPVDVYFSDGVITEVRVFKKSSRLLDAHKMVNKGRYEFSLIYETPQNGEDPRLLASYMAVFGRKNLPTLDQRTVRKYVPSNGFISVGKTNCANSERFANQIAEIDFNSGIPVRVRIFENADTLLYAKKLLETVSLGLIYQDGVLTGSFYGALGPKTLSKLKNARIRTELARSGNLCIGGVPQASFTKYGGCPIDIYIRDSMITEVRILDPDGDPIETAEFSLIYSAEGELVDSFNIALHEKALAELNDHIIVTRLDNGGHLSIGGKAYGFFAGHGNDVIAIKINGGAIVEVIWPNESAIANVKVADLNGSSREFSHVYDADGQLVKTYNACLLKKRLARLKNNTVVTNLDRHGGLTLGGRHFGLFLNHRGGIVAVQVLDGIVTSVSLLNFAKVSDVHGINWKPEDIKRKAEFQVVSDPAGKAIDSFLSAYVIPMRFSSHLGKITGQMAINRLNGFLHGNKYYYFGDDADFRGYPIREIAFENPLEPGEITQFKIEKPDGTLVEIEAKKILQRPAIELVVETMWPSRGERSVGGYRAKPWRLIGARILDPETELIRREQVEIVRRALDIFTSEERTLLLDAAIIYYSKKSHKISTKVDPIWLIQEFTREKDTLIEIAAELEVSTEWLVGSLRRLATELL